MWIMDRITPDAPLMDEYAFVIPSKLVDLYSVIILVVIYNRISSNSINVLFK